MFYDYFSVRGRQILNTRLPTFLNKRPPTLDWRPPILNTDTAAYAVLQAAAGVLGHHTATRDKGVIYSNLLRT